MDNRILNGILGALLVIALIYILFLKQCGSTIDPEITEVDTVLSYTTIDTGLFDTNTFTEIAVKLPEPYYDTIPYYVPITYYDTVKVVIPAGNYFNEESDADFILKYAAIYEDTIRNDSILIHYRAKVRGYLDELTLGYKLFTPYYIEKRTFIQTEIVKNKRFNGFYIGLDVGIAEPGIVHFSPTVMLSGRKFAYNIGYDVYDKALIAGMKVKLRFKK